MEGRESCFKQISKVYSLALAPFVEPVKMAPNQKIDSTSLKIPTSLPSLGVKSTMVQTCQQVYVSMFMKEAWEHRGTSP